MSGDTNIQRLHVKASKNWFIACELRGMTIDESWLQAGDFTILSSVHTLLSYHLTKYGITGVINFIVELPVALNIHFDQSCQGKIKCLKQNKCITTCHYITCYQKQAWLDFLAWFSPMCPLDTYLALYLGAQKWFPSRLPGSYNCGAVAKEPGQQLN